MKVDGRCLCGSITLEADIDETKIFICHCTDCQIHSGTSFRIVAAIAPEALRVTSGVPKTYRKRAESGRERMLGFCPDCGTSIYGAPPPEETGVMSLRVGILSQRHLLRPTAQIWCRSAQSWLETLSTVPRTATQPSDGHVRTTS